MFKNTFKNRHSEGYEESYARPSGSGAKEGSGGEYVPSVSNPDFKHIKQKTDEKIPDSCVRYDAE